MVKCCSYLKYLFQHSLTLRGVHKVSMTTGQKLHELWKEEGYPTAKQLLIKHQLPSAVGLLQDNPGFPGNADALLKKHNFPNAVKLLKRLPCKDAQEILKSQHFPTAKELLHNHFPQNADDLLKLYQFYTVDKLLNTHIDQNAVELLRKYNFFMVERLLKERKSECILAKTLLKKRNIVTCVGGEERYLEKGTMNLRHQSYQAPTTGKKLHKLWKGEGYPTAKQLLIKHQLPSAVELLKDNSGFPGSADALLKKHSFPKAVELLDRPPCQCALEILKSQRFPTTAKELLHKHFPKNADDLLKVYQFYTAEKLLNTHIDPNAVELLGKYNFLMAERLLEDRKSECLLAKTLLKKHNTVTCMGDEERYSGNVSMNLRHQIYFGSNIYKEEPIYATVQPRKQRTPTTVLHTQINASPVQRRPMNTFKDQHEQPKTSSVQHGRPNTSPVQQQQPMKSDIWSSITCVLCPRKHNLLLDEELYMNIDEEEEEEENIYEDINKMSLVLSWPNSDNTPSAN